MHPLNFKASVTYIRDGAREPRVRIERPATLAQAVKTAISMHKRGEVPIIFGPDLSLVGIEAIRAVRNLNDFPRE